MQMKINRNKKKVIIETVHYETPNGYKISYRTDSGKIMRKFVLKENLKHEVLL